MDVLYRLSYIGGIRDMTRPLSGPGWLPILLDSQALSRIERGVKLAKKPTRLTIAGVDFWEFQGSGAEDEARTRYPQLGRLMLYQMSYFRLL